MKTQLSYLILFLIINFGGLAIGSFLMDNGPQSEWYKNLNRAPWTPAGWVFGAAWTVIMVFFSIYLTKQFKTIKNWQPIILAFALEFVLNVSWNYIFFNQHLVLLGVIILVLLTSLLFYYFFKLSKNVKSHKWLLLPYLIWLCLATSLNLYVLIYN